MTKFIIGIIAVVIYDLYKMFKDGKQDNLSVYIFFVFIAFLVAYIKTYDPFQMSLSEFLMKFVNSKYFDGG